ncbi:MAG: hydrogenase maturation protease [Leptolyngbya sp. SIO4C1]|nr:hydrogenase maturation protease [Leptolyngbya sp. SIO4C1]
MVAAIPDKTTARQHSVARSSFLVVGYGSLWHGDDSVGQRVAQAVERWRLPEVNIIRVAQLSPRLVGAIAAADYVLFVSACHTHSCQTQVTPLSIGSLGAARPTADSSPRQLLNLTWTLHGRQPQAWLLEVPAEHFAPGVEFSSAARQGLMQTVDKIALFLRSYRPVGLAS